tara:strand:+ start:577 stop:858 length:282 start_codon:yes stop_codon:yes gene_type:complete
MAKIAVNGVIRDMTDAETSFRASEVLDTAGQLARALTDLRKERDAKLSETDYLALSDNTLSSDMTTYRQALRDITNGVDTVEKVNNVTWPTKP